MINIALIIMGVINSKCAKSGCYQTAALLLFNFTNITPFFISTGTMDRPFQAYYTKGTNSVFYFVAFYMKD
jgi:hypothetical protein